HRLPAHQRSALLAGGVSRGFAVTRPPDSLLGFARRRQAAALTGRYGQAAAAAHEALAHELHRAGPRGSLQSHEARLRRRPPSSRRTTLAERTHPRWRSIQQTTRWPSGPSRTALAATSGPICCASLGVAAIVRPLRRWAFLLSDGSARGP